MQLLSVPIDAPTMANLGDVKDKLYNDIDNVISDKTTTNKQKHTDKHILLSNFNAKVHAQVSS